MLPGIIAHYFVEISTIEDKNRQIITMSIYILTKSFIKNLNKNILMYIIETLNNIKRYKEWLATLK